MKNDYYRDLSLIDIDQFKSKLMKTDLLPSQKLLGENIPENMKIIKKQGITDLEQLQMTLKTKPSVEQFSELTGLSVEYLTLLRREVNSYHPKPINIKDYPGVEKELVEKLSGLGIKNTKQLFPKIFNKKLREDFVNQNNFKKEEILELTYYTDLARLKWVGAKFAKLLIESGYTSISKIKKSDPDKFLKKLYTTNEKKELYKGGHGEDDLKKWLEFVVKDTPEAIKF